MQIIRLIFLKTIVLLSLSLVFLPLSVGAESKDTAEQKNAATTSAGSSESQVIQSFTSQVGDIESDIIKIDDQRKRQIMFAMGVPLLIFIFITVGLGIAMGVFGKDVYIAHMIFAGLSLTLALGHAIVGLVWFWPF